MFYIAFLNELVYAKLNGFNYWHLALNTVK